MKKRTSNVSRRIVSLLMSMVLTLTLVTPAAFATEVVGGSGTAIIEGNANPADANPNEDTEGKDDVDKNTEDKKGEENKDEENKDEQPTEEPSEEIDTLEDEGENAVDAVTVWDGSAATKFAGGTGTERRGRGHRDVPFRFRQCHDPDIVWHVGRHLGGCHQLHLPYFCPH